MRRFSAVLKSLFLFYYDGFRTMPEWGRKVWIVILLKLFIIFIVLKIFFFPDLLRKGFKNDSERSSYVRNQILNSNK